MNTTSRKSYGSIGLGVLGFVGAVAALLSSGCGLRDPQFALMSLRQAGIAASEVNKKVDILWVIDNSGTMGPKQTNLSNSVSSFMNKFQTLGMDYRIAVVTTDIRPVDPLHPNDPNFSGQAACFVGTPKIITPDTADPTAALAANANVGFFGSADAHGINAVSLALSAPNLTDCNSNFLRDDAFLAVIEFSDADDNTTATSAGLVTFLDTLKPPVATPNGGNVRSYFASAIVVEDLARPACAALGPFSEVGLKFLDLAGLTGGAIASICDADFSSGLLSVSTKILESSTAVRLAQVPQTDTIRVYHNLEAVPQSSSNGWTFDSATNRIVFHGTWIPKGGTLIAIDYKPTDIVR